MGMKMMTNGYNLLERPANVLFLPMSVQEICNVTLCSTDYKVNCELKVSRTLLFTISFCAT